MSARKRCHNGVTYELIGLGIRTICVIGLVSGMLATNAMAQNSGADDAAMASLIQSLTSRRLNDLTPQRSASGHESIDLQGRFQQVSLGQFVNDELIAVACVNSVGEANTFFGRDLETGAPLPPEQQTAHEKLVAEALLHGMSPGEYQFYGEMAASYPDGPQAGGSTITIINNDGADEGFNSTAPQLLPAPGNDTHANLGDQRLALFNAAAQVWSAFLDSSVTIPVRAQFNPLTPCSPSSGGVLGSAGAVTIEQNFLNAEYSDTFYHQALANKQAGVDLDAVRPDIDTTFNSDVDTGCLGSGSHFYYGLDNATPPDTINLFVVLLHELGHGLGSSSFTRASGSYIGGSPDIWARFQYDSSNGLTWFQMNNAQRKASAINNNNLYWDGPNVRQASGFLTAGRETATGRVQLYAPNPYEGGSSVSHFNTAAFPNLLMEPSINFGLPLTLDLTRQQMRDIGWYRDSNGDLTPDTITNVLPGGGSFAVGSVQTISWTNTGGFNRNVTIELSLDGGTTFPVLVASDISNTGSYSWTVSNPPTQQGRLRVREHDFVTPSGISAANFVIQGPNTPPTFTPSAALARQKGSGPAGAVAVGTVSDGETPPALLDVTQIAGGTASGIMVDSITNVSGTISAVVTTSCSATPGTVRFQVSDGALTGIGDLQVNLSANTPPTLGYANSALDSGASRQINPMSGPTDNGLINTIDVQGTGTYTGTISVNAAGAVSVSNASPIGTHSITIRATDNCGANTDAAFDLQVNNTAPLFTPASAIVRQRGSAAGAAVTVGTVSDADSPPASLVVAAIGGGTASGITVDSVNNSAGNVTATLAASCSATAGTVRFQVSDGSLSSTGNLQISVDANTPPTLTYTGQMLDAGAAIQINPATGPLDNGSVAQIVVQNTGTYTGTISVDTAGIVSVSDAAPVGTHTIIVRATDNCGTHTDAQFELQVKNTPPTFTPATAALRQQGSPAGPVEVVGTVGDLTTPAGSLTVTQIAGGSASGISVGGISNVAGTVSATLAASCDATAGTVRFLVSDGDLTGDLTGTGDLHINVDTNSPPTLGAYTTVVLTEGQGALNPPLSGPADNGSVKDVSVAIAPNSFTGSISVNPATGEVEITAAAPVATYLVTVTVMDNCDAQFERQFTLTVKGEQIFSDGFESP